MVICLELGAYCLRMDQLMPLHPKPHNLLPNSNPDWFFPFWYWLTLVVLEKRLLVVVFSLYIVCVCLIFAENNK